MNTVSGSAPEIVLLILSLILPIVTMTEFPTLMTIAQILPMRIGATATLMVRAMPATIALTAAIPVKQIVMTTELGMPVILIIHRGLRLQLSLKVLQISCTHMMSKPAMLTETL